MKKVLSLLTVVVLAIALAGCKGKEKETFQGVSDSYVKVGNCAATSGPLAGVGVPFIAGIEAYFDMINTHGGVDGREIRFVHEDDGFDPVKGKACVEKMINEEKIFAFVGHFGTPVVGATLQDIKDAGIPAVYFATGTSILFKENATGSDRVAYPVQPMYPMEGRILAARLIGDFDATKIGVIFTNDDAGKDLLSGVEAMVTKYNSDNSASISVVKEQVAVKQADVSAAVTKMKTENVDAIVVAAIQDTYPIIEKELAKQNNSKPTVTTYVNASDTIMKNIKDDVVGKFDSYASSWVDVTDVASVTLYSEWIVDHQGTQNYVSNAYAMTGWIAAHYFVQGLKALPDGKELNWDNYMAALESAPIKNPFGGNIDFSNGQRLGTQEMSLVKLDPTSAIGWTEAYKTEGIDTILD